MERKSIKMLGVALIAAMSFGNVMAQEEESKVSFVATADLVSNYVWRGTASSAFMNPNFQPKMAMKTGGLEIGVWGSTDFIGAYKEIDPYITYSYGKFAINVTDYNWTFGNSYFDYTDSTTSHIIEASLSYAGTESLPLSASISTMLYGADKKATDFTKQNYSTYIELGYTYKNFKGLLGMTPGDSYYGDGYGGVEGFAVVNIGFVSYGSLKFSDTFAIPVSTGVYVNPQLETTYMAFGITF